MSVVKDVDLEAMPTSIFLNDDDDDDDDDDRGNSLRLWNSLRLRVYIVCVIVRANI